MSGADLTHGEGALYPEVKLDPRPRVLSRASTCAEVRGPSSAAPGQERGGASGLPEVAGVTKVPTRGFEDGYRAGVAEAAATVRRQAEERLEATHLRALEQGLEEGRQRGFTEGHAAGHQRARDEAQAAVEAAALRLTQLDRLLATLPAALTQRLEEVEDDMVALCHAALCRIVGQELVSTEGVAQHVRQAVRDMGLAGFGGGHGQLAIHVHPRDLAGLEADPLLASWLRQHASAGPVHWIPDERVRMGGCLIRSAEGSLDARLETQLGSLQRLLARHRSEPTPTAGVAGDVAPTNGGGAP